ncbi:ABC transporter permease [Candidatus Woesebacteria bacterium]|nr:ABC transporter permease [Candidatus Woesebacteria bacterium]
MKFSHLITKIPDLFKAIVTFFRKLPALSVKFFHGVVIFSSFFLILFIFAINILIGLIGRIPGVHFIYDLFIPLWNFKGRAMYNFLLEKCEDLRPFKVKRQYLIYVAYQNLKIRKSRSLITILGMSVGVGIIVYLLSLGYGIEKLVINQVASLDELKIVDVTSGEASRNALNKQVLEKIKKIKTVDTVVPFISVVGRMNYRNAKTDIVVYSVPPEYFETTRPTLLKGKFFAKHTEKNQVQGQVAGIYTEPVSAQEGKPVLSHHVRFQIQPDSFVPVWQRCTMDSPMIGVTVRGDAEELIGETIWGAEYAPFHPFGRSGFDKVQRKYLGRWIQAEFPLYQQIEGEKGVERTIGPNGQPAWSMGCVQESDLQITQNMKFGKNVLGESTSSAELTTTDAAPESSESALLNSLFAGSKIATNESGLEIVYLEKEEKVDKQEKLLPFKGKVSGEAIISSGLMNILGLTSTDITKQSFKVSFIIIKSLMPETKGRIMTEEVEYKIAGVVEDNENQFIYIPISDMQVLGVSNYSQAKVILADEKQMPEVRKEIETMGYKTTSTADTVSQIESFFANVRGILGVLGFIALAVASLGMFNTLTVSLLERTREIGGMKTMGMVSGEIRELFLAEAMIMGFAGGIGGLLMGIVVGKLTSYIVSIFAIAQGVGYLELTFIPFNLTIFIIMSSFVVGVLTGLYPAYRAQRISALNALRYE